MPVEPLRHSEITRLEKAMRDHDEKDDRRFSSLEGHQQHMAGQLDVLVDQNAIMMGALGLQRDENRDHKPVALMGQKDFFFKFGGAVGGFYLIAQCIFAAWPYLLEAFRAAIRVH